MNDQPDKKAAYPKTAACLCGALTATASEPPRQVNLCSCHDCQRSSGSAFAYNAFFPEIAISISGDFKTWRNSSGSGRWSDTCFCPACGSAVFSRLEVLPGMIAVAAGCFADADFDKPNKFYWAKRRHPWVPVPEGVDVLDEQ